MDYISSSAPILGPNPNSGDIVTSSVGSEVTLPASSMSTTLVQDRDESRTNPNVIPVGSGATPPASILSTTLVQGCDESQTNPDVIPEDSLRLTFHPTLSSLTSEAVSHSPLHPPGVVASQPSPPTHPLPPPFLSPRPSPPAPPLPPLPTLPHVSSPRKILPSSAALNQSNRSGDYRRLIPENCQSPAGNQSLSKNFVPKKEVTYCSPFKSQHDLPFSCTVIINIVCASGLTLLLVCVRVLCGCLCWKLGFNCHFVSWIDLSC